MRPANIADDVVTELFELLLAKGERAATDRFNEVCRDHKLSLATANVIRGRLRAELLRNARNRGAALTYLRG